MCRFYGISPKDVLELDHDIACQLYDWIEPLECQEDLRRLKISDYPMMKPEARKQLHKGLFNAAYPKIILGEPRALTLEDMARMSNG